MIDRFDIKFDGKFDRLSEQMRSDFKELSRKLDQRFGWQSVLMAALGVIVLFGEPLRELISP